MSKLSKSDIWLTIKQVSILKKCSEKTIRRRLSQLMSKLDKGDVQAFSRLTKREKNKVFIHNRVVKCDFDYSILFPQKVVNEILESTPIKNTKVDVEDIKVDELQETNSLKNKIAILSNEKKYLIDKVSYLEKDREELKKELIEVNQERRKEAEQFRILLMKEKEFQIQAPKIDSKSRLGVDLYGVLVVLLIVGMLLILGVLAVLGW